MESSAEEQETSWISSFCGARGHEFFCQVDRNYIEDGFNLYGLKGVVENFGECLDVILDRAADESDAASGAPGAAVSGSESPSAAGLAAHTVELYGLIHARYIVTAHGLEAMHAKYARRDFGCCPRFYCDNYPALPLGLHDAVGVEKVVLYCPRCRQVFRAAAAPDGVDGAYFGTTFAHLFLMTFGFPRVPPETAQVYVPRVFGFRLHRTAVDRASGNPVSARLDAPQHRQHHRTLVTAPGPQPRPLGPPTATPPPRPHAWRPPPPESARKRPRLEPPPASEEAPTPARPPAAADRPRPGGPRGPLGLEHQQHRQHRQQHQQQQEEPQEHQRRAPAPAEPR
mmetsp:Transcript_18638/g.58625  ORF Transcript_18638/g.58625 Transcript_18638/m.58625 type:complete len:341 (+) Transcript_18638:322-1344(+)